MGCTDFSKKSGSHLKILGANLHGDVCTVGSHDVCISYDSESKHLLVRVMDTWFLSRPMNIYVYIFYILFA